MAIIPSLSVSHLTYRHITRVGPLHVSGTSGTSGVWSGPPMGPPSRAILGKLHNSCQQGFTVQDSSATFPFLHSSYSTTANSYRTPCGATFYGLRFIAPYNFLASGFKYDNLI